MSNKLLNHLSANAASVFQSSVRLFPPGFPKSDEESTFLEPDFDKLNDLIEDLNERIESIDSKVDKLK